MKSGGYEAEFGQSIGGVVNVIIKEWLERCSRVCLRIYCAPTGLEATWKQYQLEQGTVQTLSSQQH